MIPKDSKWFQKIPKIPKDSKRFQKVLKNSKTPKGTKEIISKEHFALKEPARAQKANGSSSYPSSVRRIKDLEASALLGYLKILNVYIFSTTVSFGKQTLITLFACEKHYCLVMYPRVDT